MTYFAMLKPTWMRGAAPVGHWKKTVTSMTLKIQIKFYSPTAHTVMIHNAPFHVISKFRNMTIFCCVYVMTVLPCKC